MYEDAPDDIVHDMLTKATYETHPLGYPILGTEETAIRLQVIRYVNILRIITHLKM